MDIKKLFIIVVLSIFSTLYELDLMSAKPACGFYKINMKIVPEKADKRLIGTQSAEVVILVYIFDYIYLFESSFYYIFVSPFL